MQEKLVIQKIKFTKIKSRKLPNSFSPKINLQRKCKCFCFFSQYDFLVSKFSEICDSRDSQELFTENFFSLEFFKMFRRIIQSNSILIKWIVKFKSLLDKADGKIEMVRPFSHFIIITIGSHLVAGSYKFRLVRHSSICQ